MITILIGSKKDGYLIDVGKQALTIYQRNSLYDTIKKKPKEIVIHFNDIEKIEVSYSKYDTGVWGINCALLLYAHTKSGSKIPFHGVIEASIRDILVGMYILTKEGIQIEDTNNFIELFGKHIDERVNTVILEYIEKNS